ncbi:lysophosphatidylcholine acyltransferase 2-like isoform X1 [Acanthaster planci]|uniref:Lysophosphatidylcholine acyltransferase 2-like isoform X1 n=1 Tax=Acanthaster planci TaxID=133434 RepID=A0A8B7YFM6_ACAPL|nr:lysophosphatidylcholine acyltransferase 2-like isoform X1 [Acanthaster planci]
MEQRPETPTVRERIPRSKSLIMPTIANPFVHRIKLSIWDKIRIAVMSVTIAPIRAILAVLFLFVDWLFCSLIVMGHRKSSTEQQQPYSGWRRSMQDFVMKLGRVHIFLLGFHWIEIRGVRASPSEAHILVLAPHSSYMDALIVFACHGVVSGVSREENGRVPLFGTLVDSLQPVYVSRTDPNSRLKTIQEIKRRCQPDSQWPQIVIFPEGTCTNGSCLITFKGGAFYPGVPVQPVAVQYKNDLDTFTWTWDGPGALKLLWLSLCNFSNKLQVTFLPIYTPSEEEIQDPKLFARNVRAVIANAIDKPVTDHTFEDCRLMMRAQEMGLPLEVGLVEFQKLLAKLGVKMDHLQERLKSYADIAKSGGYIGIEDLAKYLELPVSPALKEVFGLYDRDGSGKIDFREYVIGCSLLAQPANNDETLKLAFGMFGGDKNYIEPEDMCRIMNSAFGMADEESLKIFKQADVLNSGKVTYDEFKQYMQKKPEYAKLFTTYQRLVTLPETIEADFKNKLCTTASELDVERSQTELKTEGATSKTGEEKKRD